MEYISLKDLQGITLELLLEFDEFCTKHNIEYVLGGGSLLGAVRHQGFIPWDDDADVMMMRDQYEKLLEIAAKEELPAQRKIVSLKDGSFARNYARYVRTDYHKTEEGFDESDCPWVGMDIFPIDYVSGDDKKYVRQVKKINFLRKLLLSSVSLKGTGSSTVKKIGKDLIRPIIKAIGPFRLAEKLDREGQRYNKGDKTYIAALCGMYGLRERWKYADYEPKIRIAFEGHMLPVPKNYDIYLGNLYRNYMELPPENKRKYSKATVYKL